MIVQPSLDGISSLIEVPDLSLSCIWSLDYHVSVVDKIKISMSRHSRDNVEISFNIQSEVWAELTLGWLTLPFINVDNVPLLMDLTTLVLICLDMSSLGVSLSLNIHVLVFVVNSIDVTTFILEHLPPSGCNRSCGSKIWMSTVGVDLHDVVLPVHVVDSLGLLIESPLSVLSST